MKLKEIERRLDELLSQWMKASPAERARLVVEQLRLERQAEELRRLQQGN